MYLSSWGWARWRLIIIHSVSSTQRAWGRGGVVLCRTAEQRQKSQKWATLSTKLCVFALKVKTEMTVLNPSTHHFLNLFQRLFHPLKSQISLLRFGADADFYVSVCLFVGVFYLSVFSSHLGVKRLNWLFQDWYHWSVCANSRFMVMLICLKQTHRHKQMLCAALSQSCLPHMWLNERTVPAVVAAICF